MSKCKLPDRQVDAVIDGIPGKKLYDACNGKYLGSVVDDPTPAPNAGGENYGVLSYGTGTQFTPGVPISEPDYRLPWPFGLLVLVIMAFVLWQLFKTVRAKLSRSD